MIFSKSACLTLFLVAICLVSYSPDTRAEGFDLLGSIPSSNGLYYTTMAPQGDFIAMGDQRSPGAGIDIISVGDLENMVVVGQLSTGHMTYQLAWDGDYIYAPASWDGLYIYDVSDFDNIAPIADTSFGESITVVAIRDNFALLGGSNIMYSVNIQDPHNPQVVWSSNTLGCSYMVLGETIAYAFRNYIDVILIDISDLENPQEISRFQPLDVNGMCISPDERYIYLTGQRDGLIIYNIENPESPYFISHTPLPNNDWCIDVCVNQKNPDILFISAYIDGLWAVDVSDPEQPVPLHHYMPTGQSHYVMSYQDVLFHTIYNSLLALDFTEAVTDISDHDPGTPIDLFLSQNYPNPFNGTTRIEYNLSSDGFVLLEIFDLVGRKVQTIINGTQSAGLNTVYWDTGDCPSGVYFYKLTHENRSLARRLTLLK